MFPFFKKRNKDKLEFIILYQLPNAAFQRALLFALRCKSLVGRSRYAASKQPTP
jgi:hypothetical protein